MLLSLVMGAALAGPVRHMIHVDVSVAVPTTVVAPDLEAPEAPVAGPLDGVRVTRFVPTEGDVPLACSSQADGTGEFLESHATHRARLFLRNGALWLEQQPTMVPEDVAAYPPLTCAFDSKGKHIEWKVVWTAMEPPPEPEATETEEPAKP
ncbi:MAG: hypothetical protein AAGA48_17345 [Myxococcota bacterium]